MSTPSIHEFQRLTQPDWCNAPQPGNWKNACMRPPGHEGEHAVRKWYDYDECFAWPDSWPVRSTYAYKFPDLWHPLRDAEERSIDDYFHDGDGWG